MTSQLQFDGGLTLSLPVSDLDAAIGWYQSILGFELIYRLDEMGWCEMASPVARVNVGLSVVEQAQPGGATPTFGVTDIEVARQFLGDRQVKIDGDIVTIPDMVRLLTFYDPDGNSLMFYQDLSTHE
jgi:catechol 2,3-dioxygenase-like lactoylglutathione lyase family enzyme